jgi:signal transduction histidine kinase/CheY-like chemotaxis protein
MSNYVSWLIILPAAAMLFGHGRFANGIAIAVGLLVPALFGYEGLSDKAVVLGGVANIGCMLVLMGAVKWTLNKQISTSEKKCRELEQKIHFFVEMNHEIRNPLNALIASVDLLSLEVDGADDRRTLISPIKKASEHIISLVNEVLEIRTLENDKGEGKRRLFSIRRLSADVIDILSTKADAAGIELVLQYKSGITEFWVGSASGIRQVLINLISNAIQHSSCTRITISIGEYEMGLAFKVKDNGTGIPEENIAKIFNPYLSTATLGGFSGLGLSICKMIIEDKMSGSIKVQSKKNEGTTFAFSIPLIKDFANEENEYFLDTDWQGLQEASGFTVLLVENDVDNGAAMRLLLQSCGFHVSVVRTSQEAISFMRLNTKFDIVLIDHNLGVNSTDNGIDLTKHLLADGIENVIGVTGSYSPDIRNRWLDAGAKSILQKPVSRDILLSEMNKVLAQSSSSES